MVGCGAFCGCGCEWRRCLVVSFFHFGFPVCFCAHLSCSCARALRVSFACAM
jgi:hypothetical protein